MASAITFRIASEEDLPALADLRWRLKTDDEPISDGAAYSRFVEEFVRIERDERKEGEIFHWIADTDNRSVAAMSVITVQKVVAPGESRGRWGYLTNCYVLPQFRNAGVGSALLEHVQRWAISRLLEFLLVWPSDRAFPFYGRSGFNRPNDPLVWTPAGN